MSAKLVERLDVEKLASRRKARREPASPIIVCVTLEEKAIRMNKPAGRWGRGDSRVEPTGFSKVKKGAA